MISYSMFMPDNRNVANFSSFRKKWEINSSMDSLCRYLAAHSNERLILRQLHQDLKFSDESVDHVIERAIKNNWVLRENREYTLLFPIFDEKSCASTPNQEKTMKSMLLSVSEDLTEKVAFFSYLIHLITVKFNSIQPVLFLENEKQSMWLSHLIIRNHFAKTDTAEVYTMNSFKEYQHDFLTYFANVRDEVLLNKEDTSSFERLGDVNPAYFIDEVVKLSRVPTEKRELHRPLYTSVLQQFGLMDDQTNFTKRISLLSADDFGVIEQTADIALNDILEIFDLKKDEKDTNEMTVLYYIIMQEVSTAIQELYNIQLPHTVIVEK